MEFLCHCIMCCILRIALRMSALNLCRVTIERIVDIFKLMPIVLNNHFVKYNLGIITLGEKDL